MPYACHNGYNKGEDRRDLLDLYNAINGTDYRDSEALKITTLEDALFLGMKNDMSFIVGTVLNLYEHQSTKCRNMPLRVLNINQGHNRELMEKCRRLREYAAFIECVKQNLKDGMEIQEAVSRAMDMCEEQGILTDLLARCRTEVLEMLLAEYDEQKTIEYIRREEREIGREEGKVEGWDQALILSGKVMRELKADPCLGSEELAAKLGCTAETVEIIRKAMDL